MARTAPVPNIPPIPGMCPSIAVMGGGAGSGGGGGNGAGDGSGNGAGSGAGNGDAAASDGSTAGTCGTGTGGSCPQHSVTAAAGDPVDVITGNVFTLPATDLWFRGPLNLVFCRRYRSELRANDVGLGWGWTHNLAWRVETKRNTLRVISGTGAMVEFPLLEVGEQSIRKWGWLLHRDSRGLSLRTKDDLVRRFDHPVDDVNFLSSVTFRTAFTIALVRERGKLLEAIDPAGRRARFVYDPKGRILEVQGLGATSNPTWQVFARYSYRDDGALISATDADGYTTVFEYDDQRRLIRYRDPVGVTTHYVYDAQSRCTETWVLGRPEQDPDPALAPHAPTTLADGTTPARGFFHARFDFDGDGDVAVTTSRVTRRYSGNPDGTINKVVSAGSVVTREYDQLGLESRVVDPLGATTIIARDESGNIIKWFDALGRTRQLRRDASGRVVAASDPLGATALFDRDLDGNVVRFVDFDERIFSFVWNQGLLREVVHAAGHRARYRYDSTLDLVEIEGLEGEKFQLSYDAYGRLVRVGRPDGSEERYGYSLAGDLLYSRDPDGAEIHYEYDGVHKLIAIRYPDGRSASIERGGRHFPFRFTKPDGSSFTVRYDREGKAVLVENALGEQHTLERSPDGYIIGEKTFDGRSLKYRYDAGRRLVRFQEGKEHTLLEYDLAGNMIECQYSDGSGARFEYDARDLMVAATTGTVAVRFERDPAGRVVRETQVVAGDTASIDTRYDPWGLRAARVTSANHSLELQRRGGGGARRVTLDERDVVEVEPSQMGLVSTLRLAGGGALGFHHDASGRIVGQEVRSNRPNPPPPNGTPDFPHVPPAPNLVRAFRYDRRASLTTDWDRARGYRFYEYDALGQVTSRTDERGGSTTYSYDSAGNVESAAGRKLTYGPNRRPTQVGDSEQAWDECGRLIVKKGPANSWTFHWAARTQLRRAVRDDGLRVEYLYDALGRRVKRSVLDRTGTVEETRFVWDRETLVHEVSRSRGSAESTTTTYWLTPGSSVPIARRDESKGWCFYLNEPSGAPHRLVNQRGDVVSDVELGVFGEDTKRPMTEKLRFPGQMADEHTGLFYNRFRWYDPLSARYTSPDPLGMLSGLNLYRYAENIPTTWADPTGLLGGAVGFLVLNDGTTIPRDGGLMPSGHPGRSMDGVTIPRNTDTVTDAIPRLAPADRPRHTPGSCVEAHLMSELERENYRPEDIAPGGMVIMDGRTNQIKPPCNYCGPMLEALGVRPDQIRTA